MGATQNTDMPLVHDTVIDLSQKRGVRHAYRFRVWRSALRAVVLMEPSSRRCPPPDIYSVRAANLVTRVLLGFSCGGLAWYEHSPSGCYHVRFNRMGHELRQTLYEPVYVPKPWPDLSAKLGIGPEETVGDESASEEGQEEVDFDI